MCRIKEYSSMDICEGTCEFTPGVVVGRGEYGSIQ